MLINKESLQSVFTELHTAFNNAFQTAPTTWDKIAMKIPSNSGSNFYGWLSAFPKMRPWIGAKHVQNLTASDYEIPNNDFEATIEVERKHIEDDQHGMYMPQAQMAGYSAAQLPDEMVFEAVNQSFSKECYDGKYFFDTEHEVAGQPVSNKGTSPLSNTSLAAAQAGFGAARASMRAVKDEDGRSLNVTPTVLLVGTALEDVARMLLTSEKLADGSQNPYKGAAELVIDARIESQTAWFLLDTSKPIRPFIYQERKAPEFVAQVSPQSESVFSLKAYKFGAEARVASGYGFWQLAYGSTGAGA
ncbi:Mu-like prophage major head subunit gpT family protein [Pseudomonas anguilliseptica]|uniref:Mu-like prophage major head subunit gpT n=1 Tax=Pseudomonas anguilliseptica TaxID=53406 RepID=A0A1H5FBL7_PSEAG|nr:Mu-like prophage major head subunit gpT family protein [Pseudomonas anguilliseptica]SEE00594.1 Mu-like prophage major head subunit gpT [Pseudomonas anguilliseptica]